LPPSGPQRRRQIVLLAVFVPVAVGLLWYELKPVPAATKPPASNTQTRTTGASAKLPDPVKLGALDPVPDEPTEGRNLFKFGEHPPPPRPPQPAYVAPPPPPPGPPPPPPGPPPIAIKFTGRYAMPDGKVMVQLKDPQSGATFMAGEGQIVDGRYRLLKIGLESVVMAYLDGTGQRTIGYGG
jgi:hypothetical protein